MLLPSVFALDNSARYWILSVSPPPCEFESRFLILSLSSPPTNRLFLLSETCFSLTSHFSIFICLFLPIYFHLPHHGFFCSHIFHSHATVSPSLYPQSGNVLDEHFQTPAHQPLPKAEYDEKAMKVYIPAYRFLPSWLHGSSTDIAVLSCRAGSHRSPGWSFHLLPTARDP